MKHNINSITILIFLMTLLSCQRNIELNEIIDSNSPFILTQQITKVEYDQFEFKIDTLKINSEKWIGFMSFMRNNIENWKSTPASYNSDFYIEQNDFRLLGWKDGKSVVISFQDKNDKVQQLTKEIKKDELDFLND